MTLRRLAPLVALLLFLAAGAILLSRIACREEPSQTDIEAKAQVDSQPVWQQQAADSQQVLDSLGAIVAKVRADSARVARQLDRLRQRKDSLARVTAHLTAVLDSQPPLAVGATASDSTAHWESIALGQGHVIRTMADEILACRQGDQVYEERLATLEGGLTVCERRASIFREQRDRAWVRLDRSVRLLDKMLEDKKHAGDWRLPLGIRLPGWTKDAVFIVGAGYAGYRIGKGS